ncbi:MAG: aminopeptidase [Candidatus Taylorbacteria bacterium]|nr:aminopeptidase [Candidatus Taylorbacteria bacterium]
MPKKTAKKSAKPYIPSQKILERYADVLVNFALGGGKGIKKGEVVRITAEEYAKPFYLELRKAVWKAGGHVLGNYLPSNDEQYNVDRDFFIHTQEHQLSFFPDKHLKGLIEQLDHTIFIDSETNKQSLAGIDPKKLMQQGRVMKPWMEWRNEKENAGKFTWTMALYATEAMAKEAGLSHQEYWKQIIDACFLNEKNPIAKWKQLYKKLESYRAKLNALPVDKFHIQGPDADLWIKYGEKRAWMGGSGRNIPSFELFTSPDWRGTEGWIRLNQPLYRYGNLIEGIELHFKDGKVVKSSAKKNEKVLKEMIAQPNADKIGEFSMTDKRFSRITKFMAETLYDENVGGPNGNTHIALGNAYHDCYASDPSKVTKEEWERLGYNNSSVHTDVISTTPRIVTAHMTDGTTKVIYKNGMYVL